MHPSLAQTWQSDFLSLGFLIWSKETWAENPDSLFPVQQLLADCVSP